jgi:aminoglycoside phosphotransferase (APT) family kinase protein
MLPQQDNRTLSRYLLSLAETIHLQLNRGLDGDAPARLRECATVAARVAQQLDCRAGGDWAFAAEADALLGAGPAFAAAQAERARAGLDVAAAAVRALDAGQLQCYLRRHPLGGAATTVREARLLAGGRCKLTALVEQRGAQQLPETFILRQDWHAGATDTSVAAEHELLNRLAGAGLRVPRSLLLEAADSEVGEPFILVERMPGKPEGGLFEPPRSTALARQLAEQLGRLHALPAAEFGDPLQTAARRQSELTAGVARLREMQAGIGIRSRTVEAAIDWVAAHLGDAGTAVTLTHNDVGFHNSLVDGDRLTALLDWELARLGHPAEDLGYIRHFVPQMMPWQEFLAVYQEAGGWVVQQAQLDFHTLWSALRLYGLVMQARAAIAADKVNDMEIAFVCADNLMLLLAFMAERLLALQTR